MKRFVVGMMAALLGVAIVTAAPAAAEVTDVSGSGAFGESLNATVLGTTVTSGPLPTVDLPSGGGGPITNSALTISLPGVLTGGILNVSTEGTNVGTHSGTAHSTASLANANVLAALGPQLPGGAGPLLTADLVSSECTSNGDGSSGSSTLASATIPGVGTIAVNPPPNTTINVIPGLTVILNEQIVTNTTGVETKITVNAIHVIIDLPGIATADIILSQSRCRAAGPDVLGGAPTAPTATPVVAGPKFTG
jgi:hypothetical protein